MNPADDENGETDDGDSADGPLDRVAGSPLTLPAVVAGGLVTVALLTGGLPFAAALDTVADPAECAVADCPGPATEIELTGDPPTAEVVHTVLPPHDRLTGDPVTRDERPPETVVSCHACSCTGCGNVTSPVTDTPNATATGDA